MAEIKNIDNGFQQITDNVLLQSENNIQPLDLSLVELCINKKYIL